jgi:hypothetical protein
MAYNNLVTRPSSEYYEDAFSEIIKGEWQSTGQLKATSDLRRMCYYKALSVFVRSREVDMRDRRCLVANYIKQTYDLSDSNNDLNVYMQVVPIESMIDRFMDLYMSMYNKEPLRVFSSNETTQNAMSAAYYDAMANLKIKQAAKYGTFCGSSALLITYNSKLKGLEFINLTPDQYIKNDKYDENGNYLNSEFWYVTANGNKYISVKITNDVIETWDVDNLTGNAKLLKSEKNALGLIPVAYIEYGDGYQYKNGMLSLLEVELAYNQFLFQSRIDAIYNASPIKIGVNLPDDVSISPSKVINVTGVTAVSSAMPSPESPNVQFFKPEPEYMLLSEYAMQIRKNGYISHGAPASFVETDRFSSGIERVIEREPIDNFRKQFYNILKPFEEEVARISAIILRNNTHEYGNIGDLEFSIDFQEDSFYTTPQESYDFDKQRVKDGTLDVSVFLQKHGDIDNALSQSVELQILKERTDKYVEYSKYLNLGSNTQEQVETPVTNQIDNQLEQLNNEVQNANI